MNQPLGAEARTIRRFRPERAAFETLFVSGFDNSMHFSSTMGKLGAAVAGTDLRVLLAAIPNFD